MLESLSSLGQGFVDILHFEVLFFCFIGVIMGAFVGALPGLGCSSGTAILLPFVFGMNPGYALIMLSGIYYGAMYSGSITGTLLNIPGEAGALFAATEGHPLYLQGKGGQAIRAGIMASFLSGTAGVLFLTFFAPTLAEFCLKFGASERFSLMFFAFVFVSALSGKNISKNFIALTIGIVFAMIGVDPMTGFPRFAFNQTWLYDGIDFSIAILGCYAISEILKQAGDGYDSNYDTHVKKITVRDALPRFKELWDLKFPMLRGGLIGFAAGVMPGAGATIGAFLSYGFEKKISKNPEKFGHGAIEGIACTEASNNAASVGAMAPLLALGIPGSGTTAVLLTGFLMFGLQPGPTLFLDHPDIAWSLIASMYVGNIMLIIMCLLGVSVFIWLVQKSIPFLTPLIVTICVAGAYSANNWVRDVWIMVIFGIIAYTLSLLEFPIVNLLLGLILGNDMEFNFMKAILLSDGNPTVFFTRPISGTMMWAATLLLIYPLFKILYKKIKQKRLA